MSECNAHRSLLGGQRTTATLLATVRSDAKSPRYRASSVLEPRFSQAC